MKEHKRTEEQQKDYIFDIFSKCYNETASSRLQVYYPTLCEQIFIWYRDYLAVNKMGLEISKVINCFTKDENIAKIPKDKDGFFKYLKTSLSNEKKANYHEFNENDIIKIQKEEKRKLRKVKDFIKMKESQLGRELTHNEIIQGISKWFKEQEYIDLLNMINIDGFSYTSKDGNDKIDVLNFVDTNSIDPLDEYIIETEKEIVLEAVKSLLERKQERARDCYKALFTLYCIKNDLRYLYPILDQEIIDFSHKEEKKPKQYEIYMKYHPEVEQKSAEALASANLREFLKDIETYLKNKNQ